MAAGQAGAFGPNYAKARVSANRVFALIRRVPSIDSYSDIGIIPEGESEAQEERPSLLPSTATTTTRPFKGFVYFDDV